VDVEVANFRAIIVLPALEVEEKMIISQIIALARKGFMNPYKT
jgi:hypothetical protein